MLKKLTPLLLSLCALPMATSSAWAQSSIEDLDSEGDKKKAKAKKSARTSAESDEVIREIDELLREPGRTRVEKLPGPFLWYF